jgi:hypothetical protein
MKVQYRITEDDYASAARFHAWRHFIARPSTMTLVAGGIGVAVLVTGVWTHPEILPFLAFVVAGGAIGGAFGLFVHTPSRARRHYRQYKGIQELITADLTDAGIRFSNSDGEGILSWSKVLQWRQNDQLILIYRMPILFYIVPKSIEREGFDVPLLIRRLAEHVGPER